jgi:hypothetical protein
MKGSTKPAEGASFAPGRVSNEMWQYRRIFLQVILVVLFSQVVMIQRLDFDHDRAGVFFLFPGDHGVDHGQVGFVLVIDPGPVLAAEIVALAV